MKRSIAAVAVLAPIVILAAFAPGASAPQAQAGLPGTWQLVSVDGHALPYTLVEPGRPADAPPPVIVGGTFTVGADSTFQHVMRFTVTRNGAERVVENPGRGTYARDGERWLFTWQGAGQTPVTLRGDTLVMENEGTALAYLRRPRP